jgi:hypothetical protein
LFGSWLKLTAIAASSVLCGSGLATAQDLLDTLRAWSKENIYVANDQSGRPKLFIRKAPVRIYIKSAVPSIIPELRTTIGLLSDTFHLSHEFTSSSPNLIIAVAPQISDGSGRPNRALLKELGLPDFAIDMIKEDWSTGCGYYVFGHFNGHISTSVAVADTRREPDRILGCLVTATLSGFGLSIKPKTMINPTHGIVQYLILARALRSCADLDQQQDGEASIKVIEERYADCAAHFMVRMFE